jgi:parallel beta-helix repeat protein
VQDAGAVDVSDNSYVADAKTTKNIKKEPRTHVVNNDTVQTVFNKEGTSPYNNAGFSASLLGDEVEDGDTLDFQGQITGNYNLSINKAVNIISSTNDANISLNTTNPDLTGDTPGNHFIITPEGSYTNITGINFYNTQLFVYNTTCVTLDNINAIVYDQRVGGGVGQTSIRANSTNITVKNSNFYTFNNGGSSTLVLAWADNCTLLNNTINADGESGNLLYLTTYNTFVPGNIIPNSNNLIINNSIGNNTIISGGIQLACVLSGANNTIKGNKIYGSITGQYGMNIQSIEGTVIDENMVTGGILAGPNSRINNNNIKVNAIINYNSTVENNTFENVTLSESDIIFKNNTVNGAINIESSNATITNNTIISPYDYAINGGTTCTITNNYISTYYTAGEDAIINGTDNILENNIPEGGVTLTITDDNYETYFDGDGKINNPVITNYSTITLSGEFNNRIFDIDGYILNINGEGSSTVLKSSQIISEENSRIKVKSLTINNTESNIESMIILNSELNTLERCNLIDYSTSTDNTHRTIMVNADNNILTHNNINTSAPSVNIDYTRTPILPDCISIVVSSSNNNITNNNIQCLATTNNNEYGTIEAIVVQSPTNAKNNNISRNTITVRGSDYVYGINIGANANNNIIEYNNIKVDSTTYSAGIQIISPANNNNISYNNINSTAATTDDKSAYGILVMNDSYDTVKAIQNNTITTNNLRVVGFNSYGIEVYKSDNNKVSDNTIIVYNSNYATGIALTGENNIINSNKLLVTGKSNETSLSYDNILPTTAGINIVNSYNNTLSQNQMNVTKGSGIKLDNATKTTLKNNNVSAKTSVGLNIANSQENRIVSNNITADTSNTVLINQSTTNTITDNRLVTSNTYTVDLIDSTDNIITNNYMTSGSFFGDIAVNNPEGNTIANNTPSLDNAVYINNITYSNYFDDEGKIKDNSIVADSTVIIVGDLYDKDMVFDVPVNITVYGSTPTIYNSTITFKEGSEGSNTTAPSSELTSQLLLTNYDSDSSSIIIENTCNINISTLIYVYGQNSNGIKVSNSTDITLYSSYISGSALKDTGLNVDRSSNLNLDIRTSSSQNNFVGMKFTNTNNVNITNYIVWSELSGINSTTIEINKNTSNFYINNTIRVQATRQNSYALKINATQDQPAQYITYNGTIDIYANGNYGDKNITTIYANYCQNSIFNGNIHAYQDCQRLQAYDIYNSENNIFSSIITKEQNSYRPQKSYNTLAKLTNSNNNTITNITFTPPLENYNSANDNKGITLNNSNNNKIINNNIIIPDQYCIYLYNSNENTVKDNYLNSTTYGDYSVFEENCADNTITDNTPRQLKLTDDNYNQYFDENSKLIGEYDLIEVSSDINNKDLILSSEVYISNGNDYVLTNVTISLIEESNNSIIEGLTFNNIDKKAIVINNTSNIKVTDNTIILPETPGEAIEVANSDNITINNNYIETKDLIANLAIKTTDSTNTNYIDNTPLAVLTDDEYTKYFNDDGTFKYDSLDKIVLGSDIKNKDMIFNSRIEILNPDNYTIYNGTITLNENSANSQLSNLIINNSDDRTNTITVKSTNNTITNNIIHQTNTNTPASIILIEDFTSDTTTTTQITNNNITFRGDNMTAIEITNINTFPSQITNNKIIGTGNNNKIFNFENIENPMVTMSDNYLKLNTTTPSIVININNITGNYTGMAFYIRSNKIATTTIQNTTPLVQVNNNVLIAYISSNFIESKDLKGDQAVNGSPQYTRSNYPANGRYRIVEVTSNIPEAMIVNKTYDLTFTIKDLVGDDVNKGTLYLEIDGYDEYELENTNSSVTLQFTPTRITDNLEIYYRYREMTYEYAMLEEAIETTKVVQVELKVDPINVTVGEKINITANICADGQIFKDINKGKVIFKVNGKTLKDVNGKVIYAKVINGTATLENYLVPSDWIKEGTTIEAVYSGSTQCEKLTSEKTNITVTKATPTLTTNDITATAGETITLTATITDNDKTINTGKVVFKINGKTVKDENGKVIYAKVVNNQANFTYTLPENMKAKDYNITAVFTATNYDKLEDVKTLTITA